MSHPYQVGNVISSSWGYDQTNVDFYIVTRVAGAMIEIKQLKADLAIDPGVGSMTGQIKPSEPHEFHPDFPKTIRKRPGNDGQFKLESWGRWCRPWDGKPKRCSWYG